MGRNNRARRQQKQRGRQKKQKTVSNAKRRELDQLDELSELCHPVAFSLAYGEPPSPGSMADWTSFPIAPVNQPIRILLTGFIDYLFHGHMASGKLDDLTPHQDRLMRAGFSWLYTLLYAYCLISDQALAEGDMKSLSDHVLQKGLPCDVDWRCRQQTEVLCAPFYITLWLMGRPVLNHGSLRTWLQHWLRDSPWHRLVTPLDNFLKLKSPKPQHKAARALELALNDLDGSRHHEWQDGIGRLLGLFLQQRLSTERRKVEVWQDCPQIARLCGLIDTQAIQWRSVRFEEANTATLNRLNQQISTDTMPYAERVILEAFKCRLLSRYVKENDGGRQDFERQLGRLLNLMSRGVPSDETMFAERCLDSTCEWLAEEVGRGHFPAPSSERMKRIYRCRPDDYRVALLMHMATRGREPALNKDVNIHYQHIHFSLFFQAFHESRGIKKFLDHFYWALTGEHKKALFTWCCRHLFLATNEFDSERLWAQWRKPLFDVNREPFASIVKGQACEAEMLFYTALAAVDTSYDVSWLQADHVSSLVRSSADLLTKHASQFNQGRVINLLNSLTGNQHAAHLVHTLEPVLTIIRYIERTDSVQHFLCLALNRLNDQPDCFSDEYNDLITVCRRLPALQRYLPQKEKVAENTKTDKTAPFDNLDLFGNPS